jgi:ribosomal protein L27
MKYRKEVESWKHKKISVRNEKDSKQKMQGNITQKDEEIWTTETLVDLKGCKSRVHQNLN